MKFARLSIAAFAGVLLSLLGMAFISAPAFADRPLPWQMGLQPAATDIMQDMRDFHGMLLVIITGIVIFVTALLGYILVRFNAKRNPVPAKFAHNTLIEVVWTVIPVVILLIIAVPSFRLLFKVERLEKPEMTVKVIGHQWYWSYEYPKMVTGQDFKTVDHTTQEAEVGFDSNMIFDPNELKDKSLWLLEVDNPLVVPVDTTIQVLVTAKDVLHAFAVPSFGVKRDAVPGRLNETWFKAKREGDFYGQCSELCGKLHSYMPIHVRVVSKELYQGWYKLAIDDVTKANVWLDAQLGTPQATLENSTDDGKKDRMAPVVAASAAPMADSPVVDTKKHD